MTSFGDSVHQRTTETSGVSKEQPLTLSETGVSIAIGIINNKSYKPVLVSEMVGIAEITYQLNEWDASEVENGGAVAFSMTPLSTHVCTDKEIELNFPSAGSE